LETFLSTAYPCVVPITHHVCKSLEVNGGVYKTFMEMEAVSAMDIGLAIDDGIANGIGIWRLSNCNIGIEGSGSAAPSEDKPEPSTPPTPALAEPEPSTSPALDSAGAMRPSALACLAGVAASAGILVGI